MGKRGKRVSLRPFGVLQHRSWEWLSVVLEHPRNPDVCRTNSGRDTPRRLNAASIPQSLSVDQQPTTNTKPAANIGRAGVVQPSEYYRLGLMSLGETMSTDPR